MMILINFVVGVVVVVVIGLIICFLGKDVNFKFWRDGVVMEIFKEVFNNKVVIINELLVYFWKIFYVIIDYLKIVVDNLKDYSGCIIYFEI